MIVINTPSLSGSSSALAQEMLEVSTFNDKLKEKVALKLNSLNDKKPRYILDKNLLTMCYKGKFIPQGLSICIEPSIGNQGRNFLKPGMKDFKLSP